MAAGSVSASRRERLVGALVILVDAGYIRDQGYDLWRRSFWRILATVVLIAAVTFLMVRWFLMRPADARR